MAVVALALACVCVAGYKYARQLHPESIAQPLSSCDPGRQTCRQPLAQGGELTFSIEPRPIRPLQELTLLVTVHGLNVRTLEVDLDGVDMSMGYNRPRLSNDGGNRFTGKAILPVCITGTMTWRATVLIDTDRGSMIIPFHFDSAAR